MKKYYLFWVIGVFMLVIGTSLVFSYTNSIIEKYPDLVVLISKVTLEPNESVEGFVSLEKDEEIFVTITAEPVTNSIFFSVNNIDNSFTKEIIFNDFITLQLIANTTDSFNIVVGNMGTETSSVSGFSTKNPILDDEEIIFVYAQGMIAGSLLLIVGIFLIIIGILIFVIKKKLSKKKITK